MIEFRGKYTTARVMIDQVEESCVSQIIRMINHEAFTNQVVIMPDTHAGKGSVIGFTMPVTPRVVPNVVGVDIGCGMLAVCLGNFSPFTFFSEEKVDRLLRDAVPFGHEINSSMDFSLEKDFPWILASAKAISFADKTKNLFGFPELPYEKIFDYDWFRKKLDQIEISGQRAERSIGTLGGGNHFIEFGKDSKENYWLIIHTGSRNFGKKICEYWQSAGLLRDKFERDKFVREEIGWIKSNFEGSQIGDQIKALNLKVSRPMKNTSGDLRFLEGGLARGYLFDMVFSQVYASFNREMISKKIFSVLGLDFVDSGSIESVHNYIDFEDLIIRKGAIRSYLNERMVIPLNMRDGTLICEGNSNPDWNYSAPHGAGRVLSRSKAKSSLNLEDFKKSMEGIYSTSVVKSTLDESPMAYKDSALIENSIGPTATVLDKIKPVLNMKSNEG